MPAPKPPVLLTARTSWHNPMDELDAVAISRCMRIARDAAPRAPSPRAMSPAAVASAVRQAIAACMAKVRHAHTYTVTATDDGAGGAHLDVAVQFEGDQYGTTTFTTRPE